LNSIQDPLEPAQRVDPATNPVGAALAPLGSAVTDVPIKSPYGRIGTQPWADANRPLGRDHKNGSIRRYFPPFAIRQLHAG
ncbi:MAG TPA: hypothetical protein DGB32_02575, partial [Dehalococcoidia bacterium]|nr:hypothetical protein [Dehalococcoidia bacterium]